jgi:hypothetical protein
VNPDWLDPGEREAGDAQSVMNPLRDSGAAPATVIE